MADVAIVVGLNGEEIIKDLVTQIQNRLRRDCNLTPSDSYSRGYSADVNLKLKLYGVNEVEVDNTFKIGNDDSSDTSAVVIDESIKVEQETQLNEVRERSEQPEPVMTVDSEGRPEIRKRTYTRRVIAKAAQEVPQGLTGGAVDIE